MRHAAIGWPALLVGALLSGTLGCSDDDASAIDVGPTGQPTIAFTDPVSGGAPACVAIGNDVQARVPLMVEAQELVLRPPDGCGAYAQCGYLHLTVDGVANNEAASEVVDLLMSKLSDPYHDGSDNPVTGEPDVLEVRVAVLEDDGEPMLDHDDVPLSDTVELITVVSCD